MLGYSFLFVKEADKFFGAQFKTQSCFEITRSVWIPKHLCSQKKFFFFASITLKTGYQLPISTLQYALMIQARSRQFNTLTFVFVELSGSTTIMQA